MPRRTRREDEIEEEDTLLVGCVLIGVTGILFLGVLFVYWSI